MLRSMIEYLRNEAAKHSFILSLNVIGSCAEDGVPNSSRGAREVDFYILVDQMTPAKMEILLSLFGGVNRVLNRPVLLETRRGPFKNREHLQLHLIIDDLASVRKTSAITLADWRLNSIGILEERDQIPIRTDVRILRSSLKREITQTVHMISGMKIRYKEWAQISGSLVLAEKVKPVKSADDLLHLLKYGYTAMKNDWQAYKTISHEVRSANCNDEGLIRKFVDIYKKGDHQRIDLWSFRQAVYLYNLASARLLMDTAVSPSTPDRDMV